MYSQRIEWSNLASCCTVFLWSERGQYRRVCDSVAQYPLMHRVKINNRWIMVIGYTKHLCRVWSYVSIQTNERASERAYERTNERTNRQVTRLCPNVNAALHFTLAAYEPPILSPPWPNTYVRIHTITRNIIFPRQICFRRRRKLMELLFVPIPFFFLSFFLSFFNSSFRNVNPLESKLSLKVDSLLQD